MTIKMHEKLRTYEHHVNVQHAVLFFCMEVVFCEDSVSTVYYFRNILFHKQQKHKVQKTQ